MKRTERKECIMDASIRQFYYFITVCKYMNYTKAARELYITQPALSASISRLEEDLGCTLFQKKGRNIELTKEGEIALQYAKAIVNAYDNIQLEYEKKRATEQGSPLIRFGRSTNRSISPFVEEFMNQYPDVTLTEITSTSADLLEMLLDGEFDFILVSPVPEDSRVFTRNITEEEFLLQIPKNHPLAEEPQIILSDCAGEPFMGFMPNSTYRIQADEFCRNAGFEANYKVQMETASLLDFRMTANAGNYFGLFPKSLCSTEYNADDHSVFRHIEEPKCTRTIAFQWLKSNPPGKLVRELMKSIENYICSDAFSGDNES